MKRGRIGISFPGGPVGYQGPGNVVSGALVWGGLRAYSAATIGANAIRIKRASDSTEQDFITLADGSLDVASIATFLAATTGQVRKLYDQTGNGKHFDVVGGGAFDPADFLLADLGSLPVISKTFNGPAAISTTASFTQSQPFTISGVVNQTTDIGGTTKILRENGNPTWLAINATRLFMLDNNGGATLVTASSSLADATWHAVAGVYNGGSSKAGINGTVTTGGSIGSGAMSGTLDLLADITAKLTEIGVWPSAFDNTQISNMSTNQRAYWGI